MVNWLVVEYRFIAITWPEWTSFGVNCGIRNNKYNLLLLSKNWNKEPLQKAMHVLFQNLLTVFLSISQRECEFPYRDVLSSQMKTSYTYADTHTNTQTRTGTRHTHLHTMIDY